MKFTETIEELKDVISAYEREIKNGDEDGGHLSDKDIKWREEYNNNIACAINLLQDSET